MFRALRTFLLRLRLAARARKELRRILSDPERLQGTSLRPAHAARADLISFESDGESLTLLRFSILRHPRPHRFSSQHHLVAEYWQIELPSGELRRDRGVNLSKLQGDSDGRPAGRP